MRKISALLFLVLVGLAAFATSASAAGRPRPIIIINPPTPVAQPIQSAQ